MGFFILIEVRFSELLCVFSVGFISSFDTLFENSWCFILIEARCCAVGAGLASICSSLVSMLKIEGFGFEVEVGSSKSLSFFSVNSVRLFAPRLFHSTIL